MSEDQYHESILKFEPTVEIFDQMREYHKNQEHSNSQCEPQQQDILNAMFPPKDWTDHNNKLYVQYVSHQPSSREDVIELRERLDKMLDDRQAKRSGICGIRQELFSQTFDEIIRQVTIDCPQRGLLLMRVRDQHKMTLAAYQTIYQSSVSFGIRKQIQAEQCGDNLVEETQQLEAKLQALQNQKDYLMTQRELLEKQIKDSQLTEKEKRQQQLKILVLQAQNLKKFLQSVKANIAN